MQQDEIDRMIKEAEAHSDEARRLRELADTRNNAESLAYQIEKSLAEHREKLDEGVGSTVEGRIMELRGVLESSDVAEIKAKADALQEAWTQAASAIYAQASSQDAGGSTGNGGVRALRRRGRRGRRVRSGRREVSEEHVEETVPAADGRGRRGSARRAASRSATTTSTRFSG